MRLKVLRIRMRLKREVLKIVKYRPHNFTSIVRGEKKPFAHAEKIGIYSPAQTLEVFDPRSKSIRGHFFNQRDVYVATDVILEPKQGLIYSNKGVLISESTNWSTSNLYESFPWNPGRIRHKLDGEQLINLTSPAFGHWLVEDLASTLYLIERFPSVRVLVSKNRSRFVDELTNFLKCQVIEINGPVRVAKLLMVTKQNDSGWMNPKDLQVLENFKSKIPGKKEAETHKIYATRRSLTRSPSNESQVEEIFQSYGYEVMRLEELDLISEIQLMKNVTHLAGVSGSWQFNSIWMEPHTTMVDLANENYWTELAHRVCKLKGIDYKWLVYEGNFDDQIDIGHLKNLLDSIHS